MAHHPYLVGLVGTGVGPSLTPGLHMAEASAQGLDYVYRTIDLNESASRPTDRRGSRLGPQPRLRRTERHPSVQAPGHRAPRRGRRRRRRTGRREHRRLRRQRAVGYNTDPTGSQLPFHRGLRGEATERGPHRSRRCGCGGRRRAAAERHRPPDLVDRRRARASVLAQDLVRATPGRGSTRRPRTKLPRRCPPPTASCIAPRRAWPPTPACRWTADASPSGPVGDRHRLPAAGHRAVAHGASRQAAASATAATWRCTRPPRRSR